MRDLITLANLNNSDKLVITHQRRLSETKFDE